MYIYRASAIALLLLPISLFGQITVSPAGGGGGGSGTVTSASVTTANGVSATVANATTTPAFTFTLGAITPTTVNGVTLTGSGTLALGTKNLTISNTLTFAGTDATTITFPTTSATIARTDAANTFTGVQTMTSPAITTPAITGLATGTGVASAATASTLVSRDAQANINGNNFNEGYRTTVTAAGTTTLTNADTYSQFFTGSTTQTCKLPVTSTLALGWQFFVVNQSTGAVTVQSSGANSVIVLAAGTAAIFNCISTSATDATGWYVDYGSVSTPSGSAWTISGPTAARTVTAPDANFTIARTDAANTFTGASTATSWNLVTPLLGTPTSGALTNCTSIPVNQATGTLPDANVATPTITAVSSNTGGWSQFKVSGSDATTTGQTLVDVTGLVTGSLSVSSMYEFEAVLYVTTTAVTTGTSYGVHVTVAPTNITADYVGPTTNTAGLQAGQVSATTGDNIASAAFLTTSSEDGCVVIKGFVTTASGAGPVFSIRHLKVTSGTSTVKIGSVLRIRKL